ncbi:MAG: hypothetical protein AB2556_19520, partial [Candidatus Thiodiazotropha sp.]
VDVAGAAVLMLVGRVVVMAVETGVVPGGRDVETALGVNAVPPVVTVEVMTEEWALDPEVTVAGEADVTPVVPVVFVTEATVVGILVTVVDVAGKAVVMLVGRVEVWPVESGVVPGSNDVETALGVIAVSPDVTVEVMTEEWALDPEVTVAGEADVTPVVPVVSVVVTSVEWILDPVAGFDVVMLVGRVEVREIETGVVPGCSDVEAALGVSAVPPVVNAEVMTEEWALDPVVTVAGEPDGTPVVPVVSVVVITVVGILDAVVDIPGVAVVMLVGKVEVRAPEAEVVAGGSNVEIALGVSDVPPVVTSEVITEEWGLDPEDKIDVAGVAVFMLVGRVEERAMETGVVPGDSDVGTALGVSAVPPVVTAEVMTEEWALDPVVTVAGEPDVRPAVPVASVVVTTVVGILDAVADIPGVAVEILVGRVVVVAEETGVVPGGKDVETALGVSAVPPVLTAEVMTEEWALDPEVTVAGEADVTPVVPIFSVVVIFVDGILDPVDDVAGVAVVMLVGRVVGMAVETGEVSGGRDVETRFGVSAVPPVVIVEVMTEEWALDPEVTVAGEADVTPVLPVVSGVVSTVEVILELVVDFAGVAVLMLVGRVVVVVVEPGVVSGGRDVATALEVNAVPPVVTVEVMTEEGALNPEVTVEGGAVVMPVVPIVSVVVIPVDGILDPVVDIAWIPVVTLFG